MRRTSLVLVALFVAAMATPSHAQTKLLRYPDIHGDRIAFCYAGDIWLAPASGGSATRLTAHPGIEVFPKFSPDGNWIAFTGQYDGDEQVYVIPTRGGTPKQLTFYPAVGPLSPRWGYDNQVLGWTNDGKSVLYRSFKESWDISDGRLYTVGLNGALPEPLPMRVSGPGAFSPDGARMVYSPLGRNFRSWKRYQGGWAEDLWIFDLASHKAENITHHPRTDRDPMWIGNAIYFVSDRDGTLNLYRYGVSDRTTAEVTHSTVYDVRWPSADESGKIVYELGGELHVFDTNRNTDSPISIFVPDDGVAMRPARVPAHQQIEGFDLSPKGERAVFVARGDVFTVPIEKGPTRNLTNSSGAHERWASWSPDGASIVYLSDKTGEDELYVVSQDGEGAPQQLTNNGSVMRYSPVWSPDGKAIAYSDKDGKLWVFTVADKKLVQVAQDRHGNVITPAWSPDSAFLAFPLSNANGTTSVQIWSRSDQQLHRVTGEMFDSASPAWDPDGAYLYFLSDHEFAPLISSIEFDYAGYRTTGIYAVTLQKDGKHGFPPESDEVTVEKPGEKPKEADSKGQKKTDKEEKPTPKPVRIDFAGLSDRVFSVPLPPENYQALTATKEGLIFQRGTPFLYGRDPDPASLQIYTLKDRKLTTIAENVNGYALSSDGSKVLVREGEEFNLYEANAKGKDTRKTVATKGLFVDHVPADEWTEIFNEVWRRYRDYFYVRNMHGYDWKGIGDRYRALLPYVADRADLNYVLSEMVGELNVSHAYIEGGDVTLPERAAVALPGARFEVDKAADRIRIATIYRGENEEERYRAPLTEVGVNAREGDYLLAIDGVELKAADNPYALLRNKADRPVTLTVSDKPDGKNSHRVTYNPIKSERGLHYDEWVATNRQKVSELTDGRVGYIHLPDMGADGIREFIKWYYPQIRKEGLVVDVRGNGGGNVSSMIIERLQRPLLGIGFSRTDQDPQTYPDETFYGHMVCLINETSASDGDIFPYMFRQAHLGPLIGKRTWGGVVGYTDHEPLIDGGRVIVPEFATASVDGKYVIEGRGVEPDITVENDPNSLIEGRDLQLERAVTEVMKAIDSDPKKLPQKPEEPVKTESAIRSTSGSGAE